MQKAGLQGGSLPQGSGPLRKTVRLNLHFDDASGNQVFNGTIAADLEISPGGATRCRLRIGPATVRLPFLRGSMAGKAVGTWRGGELSLRDFELHMQRGKVRAGHRWISLSGLTLAGTGNVVPGTKTAHLREFKLLHNSRTLCRGSLTLASGRSVRGQIGFDASRVVSFLNRVLPETPLRLAARDRGQAIPLDLDLRIPLPAPGNGAELRVKLLRGCGITWSRQGFAAEIPPGSLTLELEKRSAGAADRQAPALRWSWQADGPLASGPLRVLGLRARGEAHRSPDGAVTGSLFLHAEGGRLRAAGRSFPFGGLDMAAPSLRYADSRLGAPDLRINLHETGELKASAQAGLRGSDLDVRIQSEELALRGMLDLLAPLPGLSSLRDFSPQGTGRLQASLRRSDGATEANASLGLQELSFSSPDGSLLGQNLAASLRLSLQGESKRVFDARFDLNKGEALWKSSYFDFAARTVSVTASGAIPGSGGAAPAEASARWGGMGLLEADGDIMRPGGEPVWLGSLALRGWRLAPLAEVFGSSAGFGGSTRIEGTADFRGRLSAGAGGVALGGTARMLGLSALFPDRDSEIRDASLQLPVRIELGNTGRLPKLPAGAGGGWGLLDPGRVVAGGRRIEINPVPVALRKDRFLTDDPIRVTTPGAEVVLESLAVHDPLDPGFEARCTLTVKELLPDRILGKGVPVQGVIHGKLARVRLNRERLETEGRLRGKLFRGDLTLGRISVSRPFEASRTLGCSAQVDRLDLQPLSDALGVGRITGLLDVEVEDLRIAYGQPVHFAMRAESVPAPNVSQKISLKAVNALSIIGTGRGLSGLGIRFYANFFEQFPYKKIGVACSLKNDVFSLSGLIHEDGVEYLVKRPLFGINVINTRPRNRIAFSDMLGRIRRIAEQPDTNGE